jgi:DUF1680 family protein
MYKNILLLVFISIGLILKGNNITQLCKFEIPKAGSIMPKGWIFEQLSKDLTQGYIGQYDKVHKTVTHNVFVNQNQTSKRKFGFHKEWWSGEHEGYWKDGVIRMAFLTHNKAYIEKASKWINEIINSTGDTGYIGIYKDGEKPNCRFNHKKGNGELWTTSRIVMALLTYYEFTNDQKVLDVIEKAVNLIMIQYADKNYFASESNGGGVSHGVGFFENLDCLYRITKKQKYLDFAEKLYNDFNNGDFRDDDLKTQHLLDKDRLYRKHGAHIAEGLFVPQFISKIDTNRAYEEAASNVIPKLKKQLTPSGAMRCDEWIKGREGNADERYEYCGIAEMVSPINKMISYTGNFELADLIETMTFNAGQGARFPILKALSYLTTDNRIRINHSELLRRESYDAAHMAAVCCALNGSRLMPYYVEGMWMKEKDSKALVANLFGPCEFNTTVEKIPVKIKEETNYPFSDKISFIINTEKEIRFPLIIRKPHGCKIAQIKVPKTATIEEKSNHLLIINNWNNEESVEITFDFEIQKIVQPASKTVQNKGIYLKRGSLVFALPFEHKVDTVKEYNNSGFYRYKIHTTNSKGWKYKINKNDQFEYKQLTKKPQDNFWETPSVLLTGTLRNEKNEKVNVSLVPMGSTIFRRVTFSVTPIN